MEKKLKVHLEGWITNKRLWVIFFSAVFVLALYFVLDALEWMPEFQAPKSRVVEQGDSVTWMGMKLVPLSRSLRKEFNIPSKVKGMFVANEGVGTARANGVKACDVICSINGQKLKGLRSFLGIAERTRYYDGILLDVYRDGASTFISIPFLYEYGPLFGPNKGHWQLGSPLIKQLLPYGKARIMPQWNGTGKEQR